MKQADLPQRWQVKLQNYLKETGSEYQRLSASGFRHDLRIGFADKSNAFFYYAFYLIDRDLMEIAVFTEHCGYHIFPLFGTIFETLDRSGNIIKTEDFTTE